MSDDKTVPILIVSDYKTLLRVLRNLLRVIGFDDVEEARDEVSAMTSLRKTRFGAVIADWDMEPTTGYQFLRMVRADPSLAAIPFIMLVPGTKTDHVIAAKESGCNACIDKPFNAETLKSTLQSVMGAS